LPPLEPSHPHIQLRVIGEHRSNTRYHRGRTGAPALNVVASVFTGDPLARAVGQRGAAVQTHREFDAHPREPLPHALHETDVELGGFRLHETGLDGNASAQQRISALATHAGVRILDREDDASNARLNQRINTGWCATVMTTGLECYICGCACNGLFGCANGSNFRMRLAGALVPAFGNDAIALGDNTSNPRIWMRCFQAAFGER
jgi:hypothetical protein